MSPLTSTTAERRQQRSLTERRARRASSWASVDKLLDGAADRMIAEHDIVAGRMAMVMMIIGRLADLVMEGKCFGARHRQDETGQAERNDGCLKQ